MANALAAWYRSVSGSPPWHGTATATTERITPCPARGRAAHANPRLIRPTGLARQSCRRPVLIFELTFLPLIEAIAGRVKTIKGYIPMTDVRTCRRRKPPAIIPNLLCYEELIDNDSDEFEWPLFDENTASTLCYTSGTTGNPKGALYTTDRPAAFLCVDAAGCAQLSAREPSCRSCRCLT